MFARKFSSLGLLEKVVALAPFALLVGFVLLRRFDRQGYYEIVSEDGIVESLQAIFFFLSAVFALLIARKLFKFKLFGVAALFVVYGFGCFVVFGEEISWGQRIMGWESPAYFIENNTQGETTLHDDERLKNIIHPTIILLGLYGLVSPLLGRFFLKRGLAAFALTTTSFTLLGYFGVCSAIYFIYEYLNVVIAPFYGFDLILWNDLETAEFFFSAGVLAWVLMKWRNSDVLLMVGES